MAETRRQTLRERRLQDEAEDEDRRRRQEAKCIGCGVVDDGHWKVFVSDHPRSGYYHQSCIPKEGND